MLYLFLVTYQFQFVHFMLRCIIIVFHYSPSIERFLLTVTDDTPLNPNLRRCMLRHRRCAIVMTRHGHGPASSQHSPLEQSQPRPSKASSMPSASKALALSRKCTWLVRSLHCTRHQSVRVMNACNFNVSHCMRLPRYHHHTTIRYTWTYMYIYIYSFHIVRIQVQ